MGGGWGFSIYVKLMKSWGKCLYENLSNVQGKNHFTEGQNAFLKWPRESLLLPFCLKITRTYRNSETKVAEV